MAVVEAGLGGRHDATNVLGARVVVLTNVALDHTDVLGETREEIAAEKLAVAGPGAVVVIGEPEWRDAAEATGAARVDLAAGSNLALAVAAAEAFLGRPVDPHAAEAVRVPGRLERRCERPLEIWDGAHNLAGIGYLLGRLPAADYTLVVSILADKKAEAMLRALTAVGSTLVATQSTSARSLPAAELADLAAPALSRRRARPRPGRGRRPGAGAGGTGRCRSRDRIALSARGAIVRCVEPVHFPAP